MWARRGHSTGSLVIEGGQIVEDGAPADLAKRPGSRYRAMLEAEEAVREELWSSGTWRRLWLAEGVLVEDEQKEDYRSSP